MMLASLFPRITQPVGQHVDLDWPAFAAKYLRDHDVRTRKDGRLFSFAVYHNNPERADANVRALTGITIDFDNSEGVGNDAVCVADPSFPEHHATNLDGLTYCYYSTHSSTQDWPRWRLVLPLDREVSPAEWPAVFDGAMALIGRDPNVDHTCGELSRAYYTPSCEPEHLTARFSAFVDGAVCKVADLLEMSTIKPGATVHILPIASRERSTGRNDALRAVASAMAARGEPLEIIVLELLKVDAQHSPPLFTDKTEGYKGSAEAGALKFAANIIYSHTSKQVQSGQPPETVTLRDRDSIAFTPPQPGEPSLLVMASDLVTDIRPPRWLVKGHLEAQVLSEFFGEPGVGKSFLALDVGLSLATGRSWHGFKVAQTPVVYICGEGFAGLRRRMLAWSLHHGQTLTDVPVPFAVTRRSIPLSNLQAVSALKRDVDAAVEALGDVPGLFIVDTMARNFGGGDENSTKDMSAFIEHVGAHLMDSFKAGVLLVHHSGVADKTRGRGSSALKGAVDAEYSVSRQVSGLIELASLKMKDAEPPAVAAFDLQRVELPLVDEDGAPVASVVPVMAQPVDLSGLKMPRGKTQSALFDLLLDLYTYERHKLEESGFDSSRCRVTVAHWQDEAIKRGVVSDRKRFFDRKKGLEQSGQVIISGEYAYAQSGR